MRCIRRWEWSDGIEYCFLKAHIVRPSIEGKSYCVKAFFSLRDSEKTIECGKKSLKMVMIFKNNLMLLTEISLTMVC